MSNVSPDPHAVSDDTYCLDLVRQTDRGRYLTVLFAPARRRSALFALFAFKHEVEKTCRVVSEPMLGRIRLQWWRESLDGIYAGTPRRHAVITPLTRAISDYDLPRQLLDKVIDGHERDLDPAPFTDLAALDAYFHAVEGALMVLVAATSAVTTPSVCEEAARQVGVAYGMTRALGFTTHHRAVGPLAITADIAARCDLPSEAIRTVAAGDPRLVNSITEVAVAASDRIRAAESGFVARPRPDRPVALHLTLAKMHMTRLRKAGYNVHEPDVAGSAPGDVWRLLWAALARRY